MGKKKKKKQQERKTMRARPISRRQGSLHIARVASSQAIFSLSEDIFGSNYYCVGDEKRKNV